MSASTPTMLQSQEIVLSDARRWAWLCGFAVPCLLAPVWPFLASGNPSGPFVSSLSGMVLLLMITTAALTDSTWKKIFNWTTYPGFAWALMLNAVTSITGRVAADSGMGTLPTGEIGFGASLVGAAACFIPMIMLRRVTGGGAGDVKLATAIGALGGAEFGLKVILFCYIIGATCILARLFWVNGPIQITTSFAKRVASKLFPSYVPPPTTEQAAILEGRVALGPFFAAATIVILCGLDSSWTFTF
jgi:Flp pilus assembly protein protease CpaA